MTTDFSKMTPTQKTQFALQTRASAYSRLEATQAELKKAVEELNTVIALTPETDPHALVLRDSRDFAASTSARISALGTRVTGISDRVKDELTQREVREQSHARVAAQTTVRELYNL